MTFFLLQVILAGLSVSLIAGPLGCFLTWRRMSYFSATLSHAALLGVGLALFLRIDLRIGILVLSLALSALLLVLRRYRIFELDNLLGILAHGSLALGLVTIALIPNVQVDVMALLFGDILSVTVDDLRWMLIGFGLCLVVLAWLWQKLLLITVHEDLAKVEGVEIHRVEGVFLLLLSIVIALAMQVVGLLLVVSLLLIPPAVVRPFVRSPESMAIAATVAGSLALLTGVLISWNMDIPTGPAIVVVAFGFFAITFVSHLFRTRKNR